MRPLLRPPLVALGCLLSMAVLPWLFTGDAARSILSGGGIMILLALSYNMLYGQTGMLSFGHTVYSGLAAFCTIHLLGAVNHGLWFPVTLLPFAGGVSGLVFGVLFGYISTKRGGIAFAMITLGLSELISASGVVLPHLFGGEGGISANRVTGSGWFGIDYGNQLQMYYLIAGWLFVCGIAMYAFTRTPLGQIANALRDNPERVRFIGYNSHAVRFRVQLASSFFAGVAGALAALNYEIVTIDSVDAVSSGMIMLTTVIGGGGRFFGPVLGAVLLTFIQSVVGSHSHAWPFYLGLLFLLVIFFLPDGLSSFASRFRGMSRSQWRALAPAYALTLALALPVALGVIALIETTYALSGGSSAVSAFSVSWSADSRPAWLAIGVTVVVGGASLGWCFREIGKLRESWRSAKTAPT